MVDEVLHGGFLTKVVRRGDTVRRTTGPWTPAVHHLLAHLRAQGFDRCPTVVSTDGDVEVLSYLPGEVLRYPPSGWFWSETMPHQVGAFLRRLHDATQGLELPEGMHWLPAWPAPGPHEVICHGDFSPTNLLFLDAVPAYVIDFDLAGPGPRSWDVASAIYRTAPLHAPSLFAQWGLPAPSPEVQVRRMREVMEGYGGADIGEVLDHLEAQLRRHIQLIRSGGAQFAVQRAEGHDRAYDIDLAWLQEHRTALVDATQ